MTDPQIDLKKPVEPVEKQEKEEEKGLSDDV
jgi:hypothetical protein